jgi:plastocyanin domain-containing protein
MKHIRTFLLLAFITLLSACGSEEAAAPTESGRRVEITVNASGYQPSEVQATAGEPLTLVFTRTTDEGCGQQLAIPAHDIERDLPLNEAVAITITPTEAGRLRFTCGMDMYDGAIVVQ